MAWRGRGRGGSGSTFYKPEAFNLTKEELVSVCDRPLPPTFPALINKPLLILDDEKHKYIASVRQEFRDLWKASPYNIQHDMAKKDTERYRDWVAKELAQDEVDNNEWKLDPNCFPKELLEPEKKKSRVKKPKSKKKLKSTNDLEKTLEDLAKKEYADGSNDEESETDSDEDEVNEEEGDDTGEDEIEEGADYGMSYFDNGEDYLDDEDEGMDDGPTY